MRRQPLRIDVNVPGKGRIRLTTEPDKVTPAHVAFGERLQAIVVAFACDPSYLPDAPPTPTRPEEGAER